MVQPTKSIHKYHPAPRLKTSRICLYQGPSDRNRSVVVAKNLLFPLPLAQTEPPWPTGLFPSGLGRPWRMVLTGLPVRPNVTTIIRHAFLRQSILTTINSLALPISVETHRQRSILTIMVLIRLLIGTFISFMCFRKIVLSKAKPLRFLYFKTACWSE